MLVRRTSPFREFASLQRHMDELFNGRLNGDAEEMSHWAPTMDVIEKENAILLRAELPGMRESDVELTVENGTLSLSGEKRFEHEETEGHYRRVESAYGSFERTFRLPNTVDAEAIDAAFANGVLEITLPKVEKAKPKKIELRVN